MDNGDIDSAIACLAQSDEQTPKKPAKKERTTVGKKLDIKTDFNDDEDTLRRVDRIIDDTDDYQDLTMDTHSAQIDWYKAAVCKPGDQICGGCGTNKKLMELARRLSEFQMDVYNAKKEKTMRKTPAARVESREQKPVDQESVQSLTKAVATLRADLEAVREIANGAEETAGLGVSAAAFNDLCANVARLDDRVDRLSDTVCLSFQ